MVHERAKSHSDESLADALQQQIHHHLVEYYVQTSGIVIIVLILVTKITLLIQFLELHVYDISYMIDAS